MDVQNKEPQADDNLSHLDVAVLRQTNKLLELILSQLKKINKAVSNIEVSSGIVADAYTEEEDPEDAS